MELTRSEFEGLSVKDQLSTVSSSSNAGHHQYFAWFCQIHNPTTRKFHYEDELLFALEEEVADEDFLDTFELIPHLSFPQEFVAMLRWLARIGIPNNFVNQASFFTRLDGQEGQICRRERSLLTNLVEILNREPRDVQLLDSASKIVGLLTSVNPATRQGNLNSISRSLLTCLRTDQRGNS